MERRILGNTGLALSILGFGASPLGDEFGAADPAEAARAVHLAIDKGINLFDTSPYYGRTSSEQRLGAALKGRRDEVILATKCGRYGKAEFDFSAARIRRSIDESLQRLQTDYIDIFQVHDIEFGDRRQIIGETLPEMLRIQESGKARFIGITGLPVKMLRAVAEVAEVDTILSYCRYNLLNVDLKSVLVPFVREKGIGLINASPLHMRLLTDEQPPDWHPAPEEVKAAGKRMAELCRSRGARIADAALQFAVADPACASTLVGLATRAHVEENCAAVEKPVDRDLLLELEEIAAPVRNVIWPSGKEKNWD